MTRFNFLFSLLFLALPILGNANTNWLGTVSTDWFNPQNWSNGLPATGNNANIPGATASGRMPSINSPLEIHYDVQNQGQLQIFARVNNYGFFKNQNSATVKNRSEFGNYGNVENNGLFENGHATVDSTGIGFTNYEDSEFTNRSTVVVKAKFIINKCSVIYFDSPTKAMLEGDIRLFGVAYLLRGDVVFSEQTGSVLFSPDDVAMPSIQTKEATVTLDATGNATITPEMIDDGSSADYCTPIVLSVSPNHFTCADVGRQLISLFGTDGHGNEVSSETYVTILPSVACAAAGFTNGGIIGGDQYFCPGDSPAPLFDSISPVTISGFAIEYAWEKTETDPAISLTGVSEITGATDLNHEVATLSQTAWFRRKARLAGTTNFTAFSNWQQLIWQDPTPTAICQNIIVVLPTSGPAVVAPEQIDNGSIAGCAGIGSYTLSQSSFPIVGIYPVLLLVASPFSDVGVCAATIDVRTPPNTSNMPTPTHADVPVTAPNSTSCGATVNFTLSGGSTTCTAGGLIYTQTLGLPSGSFFPIGETQICFTTSDNCGNVKSACFFVKVTRPAAPTYQGCQTNGPITCTLERVTTNSNGTKTCQYKIKNESDKPMSCVAFELPKNCKTVPHTSSGCHSTSSCKGTSGKKYSIKNGTKTPFYCAEYKTTEQGIKNGQCETFTYVLPANTPVPTTQKVSVKCGNKTNTLTIKPKLCSGSQNLAAPAYALKLNIYKKGFDVNIACQSQIGKHVIEYRIERSADSINFESIHAEMGGGSDGEISYINFTDEKPLPGMNFYRITAVLDLGIDWTTDFKKIEMPVFGDFSVFPNPASSETFIDLTKFSGKKVNVQFINSTGKTVRVLDFENAPDEPVQVSVDDLTNGFYTLHIVCERFVQDKTFVVAKK